MIIFRYLLREVLKNFLAISLVLLLIFLSNQFARYLTMTASGKLFGAQLFHLVVLEIPQLLSLIFPLALYLGILLSYGRLYVDNEMVVLRACGVSQKRLLGYTLMIAAVVAVPVMLFTLWLNPVVAETRDKLLLQISANSAFQALEPGRFQQTNKGELIFYIEKMADDHQKLQDIFVARKERPLKNSPQGMINWSVMSAEGGHYYVDPVTKDRFVVADKGYRYEGLPGAKNFSIYQFGQYGVRINVPVPFMDNSQIDSIPTSQLWQEARHHKPEANAELQWRLSMPLAMLILALLAFSLSKVAPRQGRFGKLFPAILVYIIYANLLVVGQDWVANGTLPAFAGLWSFHLVMLIFGVILFKFI